MARFILTSNKDLDPDKEYEVVIRGRVQVRDITGPYGNHKAPALVDAQTGAEFYLRQLHGATVEEVQ